jgi:hypothetical protein
MAPVATATAALRLKIAGVVDAGAGSASEASVPAEITITAENLVNVWTEREIADAEIGRELVDVELMELIGLLELGARWRPVSRFDTVRWPLQTPRRRLSIRARDCIRLHEADRPSRPPPEG